MAESAQVRLLALVLAALAPWFMSISCYAHGGLPQARCRPKFSLIVKDSSEAASVLKDKVVCKTSNGKLRIVVKHRRGIGNATVVLDAGAWPADTEIVFRDFRSLERLTLVCGSRTFSARLDHNGSSSDGGIVMRKSSDGIRVLVSHEILSDGLRSTTLSWIDYYR